MKIPRKVKQMSKQLLNNHCLCFCWIWCYYPLCPPPNTGDPKTCVPSNTYCIGALLPPAASLPLTWTYFKHARILSVSKPICSLKRESFSSTRHQIPAGRQMISTVPLCWFPVLSSSALWTMQMWFPHWVTPWDQAVVRVAGKSKPLWGRSFQG